MFGKIIVGRSANFSKIITEIREEPLTSFRISHLNAIHEPFQIYVNYGDGYNLNSWNNSKKNHHIPIILSGPSGIHQRSTQKELV